MTNPSSRDPFKPGLLGEIDMSIRKIVILKASRIGDFINVTPAIRALKVALPQASISLITLPMLMEIASRYPEIDRLFTFPGYPGLAEQFFDPVKTATFFQEMQAEQFDLAIQIQGTGVYANPFVLMLGARYNAGFIRENDPPGRLAAALPWPQTGHESLRNLALTQFLGAPRVDPRPDFPLTATDRADAAHWLEPAIQPWIGIHTSARDWTRRWPIERFAQAAAQLQQNHGGTVILIGEARDREEMQAAVEATGAPFLNLAGCTSIPVTGAILARLAVFLTNDTGPAHLAYAVGAPTVTIFGGGDPERNGPLSNNGPRSSSRSQILAHPIACRPCETGTCPINLECLRKISVEQVVQTAEVVGMW